MNYTIEYDNPKQTLIQRLLHIRGVTDNPDVFLNPKLSDYRIDPFKLKDMDKAVKRIIQALKNEEKVMIFGDYDVDGITASFILYSFVNQWLNYKNISIYYPDRIKDGYGIKKHHIDGLKKKGIDLIITVDNGITSVQEVIYAREQKIDIIITDHHQAIDTIPDAVAVINPQISPKYDFKGLAGVGVVFKLIHALMQKSSRDKEKMSQIFNYFLPIVAIGTVADVVPLVNENRCLVKKGLEIMNQRKHELPESLQGILNYLKINTIDTYHIGFVIGPRINAGGRISSPYHSLQTLLSKGEKQKKYLEELEEINTNRRKLQEKLLKLAEGLIDNTQKILIAHSPDFHEGVIGIVAGRLTDKYNKPSIVLKINEEKQLATASLRGPGYFNIIELLKAHEDLLERFGGHKQAGGLSIKIDNLDKLIERFQIYGQKIISEKNLEKKIKIDTIIHTNEREHETLQTLQQLAPFGQGNQEPNLLFNNIHIDDIKKVGKNRNGHMKIFGRFGDNKVAAMFRGKGSEIKKLKEKMQKQKTLNIIGKVKKDDFNGGHFINGIHYF